MTLRARLLEVVQRSPLSALVGEFFCWWVAGLVSSIPHSLRRILSARQERIVLELGRSERRLLAERGPAANPTVHFSYPLDEHEIPSIAPLAEAIGRFPTASRLVVRPAAHLLFERSLWLPVAARDHLSSVLEFELPRQTPFRPEDTFYRAEIVDEDREGRRIRVRLTLIPRAYLSDAEHLFGELGGRHYEIETPSESSPRWQISAPKTHVKRRMHGLSARDNLLVLFTIIPALALVIVPPLLAMEALKENRKTLNSVRLEMAKVSEEHSRLATVLTRHIYIEKQTHRSVPVKQLLAALSTTFDGQVHLRQLDYSEQSLILRGTTAEPSHLAGKLDASPLFFDVAFQSTAQEAAAGEKEFALQMRVSR